MLDNNKCILAYNFSELELNILKSSGIKVVEVSPEMLEMTIKDILGGLKFKTFNPDPIKEKTIIFNNFTDGELHKAIKAIREKIKGGLLAVVTPTTIDWKFNYLVKHLIEEKEWFVNQQKGRS
ncbi:MAG: DUF3783 domain-containing protein [Clostridium sp.]